MNAALMAALAIGNVALVVVVVALLALRERERHEESLQVLFARDQSLIDELHQPLVELNAEGRVLDWNADMTELIATDLTTAKDRAFADLIVSTKERRIFHDALARVLDKGLGQSATERVQLELYSGDVRRAAGVPVSASIWRTVLPKEIRVSVLLTDLSGEDELLKQKEAMLRREQQLVEELRAIDAEKTDFIATVSHELRTPLTSIVGYIEMLDDGFSGDLNEQQKQMLSAVDRNSQRLLRLIDDVLTLARIESKSAKLNPTTIHARDLLAGVEQAMYPVLNRKGITCELRVDEDAETFEGDYGQIERVLLNVVTNAAKFTEPPGKITLSFAGNGDKVHIDVADTGCGISPEDLDRVMGKFFRTASSQEQGIQGSGLGLAIVKSIVDRHGGEVSLASEVGKGTTVSITLPRKFAGPPPLHQV